MKKNGTIIAVVAVALIAIIVGAVIANNRKSNTTTSTTPASPSSSTSSTSGSSSSQPPASSTDNPAGDSATSQSVAISSFAFDPATLTVKKGTTVTWTNKDSTAHTVTADSGTGPSSGHLSQGQTYSYKFDTVGTFKYHCAIHTDMTGTVTVTE